VSFQYQTAPERPDEIQVMAAAYSLGAPWRPDHPITVYGMWSDSRIEELAAVRLSSEIRGVMPGVFRANALQDVQWGGGPSPP